MGTILYGLPAGRHGSRGGVEVVDLPIHPGQPQPQDAVGAKVAPSDLQILPAGLHPVFGVKMVDLVRNGHPSCYLFSVKIPVGINTVLLDPAAAVHILVKPNPACHANHGEARNNQNRAQPISDFFTHEKEPSLFLFSIYYHKST